MMAHRENSSHLGHCHGNIKCEEDIGLAGEEVRGYWRKPPSKELQNLQPLQNIIQLITSTRMRRARHVSYIREKRNAYIFSFGKPKGTRLLGRHGHRSEIT